MCSKADDPAYLSMQEAGVSAPLNRDGPHRQAQGDAMTTPQEAARELERLPRYGVVDGAITPHPKGTMIQLDAARAVVALLGGEEGWDTRPNAESVPSLPDGSDETIRWHGFATAPQDDHNHATGRTPPPASVQDGCPACVRGNANRRRADRPAPQDDREAEPEPTEVAPSIDVAALVNAAQVYANVVEERYHGRTGWASVAEARSMLLTELDAARLAVKGGSDDG